MTNFLAGTTVVQSDATGRKLINGASVQFPTVAGAGFTATHVGIWDAPERRQLHRRRGPDGQPDLRSGRHPDRQHVKSDTDSGRRRSDARRAEHLPGQRTPVLPALAGVSASYGFLTGSLTIRRAIALIGGEPG